MPATCTIGGVAVTLIEDQHDLTNALDERQRFKCDVIDYSGTAHFVKGQQVIVSDPILGVIYSGYLNSDKEVIQYPDRSILHSIDCIDQRWLADKRTYTAAYANPTFSGKILVDQLANVLAPEGITQNYALHFDSTTANFNTGLLSGTAGYATIGTGDLEPAKAGSDIVISEATTAQFATGTLANMQATSNTLQPTTVNALKMQATLSFAYGTEFAQALQTASGSINTTVAGTASGTVSGSVSPSGTFTPAGTIFISGGNPGETATFTGNFQTVNVAGSYSSSASLPFSTPLSTSFSGSVSAAYQPKTKSKVKVDKKHHNVVTVDKAVADNRVDATIWTGSMTVASNDTLNYDIWIASTSPSEEAGIDLVFSDGTQLTQYLGTIGNNLDVGVWDQNGLSVSPIQDLSDRAKDAWYTRQVNLSILSGKTIVAVTMFNASNIAGTFDCYFKNCYLGSQSGSPFFGTTQTSPSVNPPTLTSVGAYVASSTIVTVVPVYVPTTSSRISPAYSIDSVKLVKNSLITWSSVLPTTGPAVIPGSQGAAVTAAQQEIFVSYDGTTWLACTNNQPLPGLPAGANVAGISLYLLELFTGGEDPTAIPSLLSVNIVITSAATATTTDVVSAYGTSTAWNTGTMLGAGPNSNGDLALSSTSYTWSNLNNMTFVPGNLSASNPTQSVSSGVYIVTSPNSPNSSWSASRFNFISPVTDFTAEADFALTGGSSQTQQNEVGFVYRQTYWGSPNNSFAYYVRLMQAGGHTVTGSVSLCYGINSPPSSNAGGGPATGTLTVLTQVTETITNGTFYHVKLVVSQNRHTVYWNHGSSPIIDILDNTYTQPGNIGMRTYTVDVDATASAKIQNFTVTNTFAGIWTSPSINLTSLGTCGNTQISWSETTPTEATQSTAVVLASLNGGTTWSQCTNGAVVPSAIIPGLPVGTNVTGKSLLIQIILSASTFLATPIITGLYARVCGAYPGSSGTRSTAPLGIDLMSRANQSGFGTAFDGQTWVKVGTGTDAIASNEGTITNTTGDVHEVLGSRTWTDEEATCRFQLSTATISGGVELRYVDANNYYRCAVSAASGGSVSILKVSTGTTFALTTLSIPLSTGTWYRMRFRVVGSGPVFLYGKIWLDTVLEPGVVDGVMSTTNPQWTITASD